MRKNTLFRWLRLPNVWARHWPAPSQANVPDQFRVGSIHDIELYEISVEHLQSYFKQGTLTSLEYVKFCLERIRTVDVYLEAVIEVNPDALQIAEEMDAERRAGKVRSLLHGVPILVKDNMATEDKMQTTAGSWAILGSVVPRDAHVVALLRKAGAIILGHSNMSEWSSMRSKSYSTGFSPRRGQVRNPYNLTRSPYGSSSGSAVSVSANIVPIALGTETDTSIIGPANANGVVGIKPTVGLTSRAGVIPISENFDSVGTFGRTVSDAVHALNAIVGIDERDPTTATYAQNIRPRDYSTFLTTKESLDGAVFGLPIKRIWDSMNENVKVVAEKVLDAIKAAGAVVIDTDFPCWAERIPEGGGWNWDHGTPSQSEYTVCKVDAYNGINAYLSECTGTEIKSLEDVVAYNEANRGTEGAFPGDHPAFASGQDSFHACIESKGVKDNTYQEALSYVREKSRAQGIDAALKAPANSGRERFDALLIFDRKGAGQQMAAQAGYPIITIPIGLDENGMPVGLSFHQTAWREQDLIKWASAVEDLLLAEFGSRQTPSYKNFTAKNIPIVRST